VDAVSIQISSASIEDLPEMARQDGLAFGFDYTPDHVADLHHELDPKRFLLAHDAAGPALPSGAPLVGIAGDFPFEVTVPGGATLPTPGVTWVSVSPTHRGRGILRQLMTHQLESFQREGFAMAVLTASQSGIYRRFGYGAASQQRETTLDQHRVRLLAPPDRGSVRSLTPAQAVESVAALHDRWRRLVPGAVSRDEGWWRSRILDRENLRDGMSSLSYFVHADGYVGYRTKPAVGTSEHGEVCWVTDFVAVTPQAHAALWQVLLGLDLHASIDSCQLPLDDPLPQLLDDPRQLRTTAVRDGIWVRPIDVCALLSARTYAVEVDAVIEVADPLLGSGRYRLQGGPDGATCARTEAAADLALGVDALGAAYLGGERLNTLRAGGRIQVADAAVARRLDLAFLTDRAPFHGTAF
jgi:predicted acetyltransferase